MDSGLETSAPHSLSSLTPLSSRPRILLCDDDPLRLQAIARQLTIFFTESIIEVMTPRKNFASAVFSHQQALSHPEEASASTPSLFPILIFFVNMDCHMEPIVPATAYGTEEGQGLSPDPSVFQLFQVCHISDDYLAADDKLNVLRYVFTISSTVLEISLCILDTIAKYSDSPTPSPTPSCSPFPDVASARTFRAFLQRPSPSLTSHIALGIPCVPPPSTRLKMCVSCAQGCLLPRVRYVNQAFQKCFGHNSEWLCGRSITVLCGLLTSPQVLLQLCARVNTSPPVGDLMPSSAVSSHAGSQKHQHQQLSPHDINKKINDIDKQQKVQRQGKRAREGNNRLCLSPDTSSRLRLHLYSARGAVLLFQVTVTVLPNYSRESCAADSVAILAFEKCL